MLPLIIIWLVVLLSGCIGEKYQSTEPNRTVPEVIATVVSTPKTTSVPEATSSGNAIQIKLDGRRGFIPDNQTIQAGDEIIWDNYDNIPVNLVSNDALFDVRLLEFYQQYRYVFRKPGVYTFSLKDKNLTGTIIVESDMIRPPVPQATTGELPPNSLYVTARMRKLSNWSTGNEIRYRLDSLKVDIEDQINIPFSIKAQILSGGQVLEERAFVLEKQGSIVEFTNDRDHFVNNTEVYLRLIIQGYGQLEYKFVEVDDL